MPSPNWHADAVAVAADRDLTKMRLRELAWELEATGTDFFVAPALLDVAGPRTTIRPVASLPLLYVDHPEFSGVRWVIKGLFDKAGRDCGIDDFCAALGG